jgi:hypothetical protein
MIFRRDDVYWLKKARQPPSDICVIAQKPELTPESPEISDLSNSGTPSQIMMR